MDTKHLEVQKVRVRNKKHGGIHAYLAAEAIAVEDNPMLVEIEGIRTTGEQHKSSIFLPQSYAYLMMKIFAFRDWEIKRKNPSIASKHALDLYSIVALMTEKEFAAAEVSSRKYRQMPAAEEAAGIVEGFFSGSSAPGTIRLREHQMYSDDTDLSQFISVLTDLFCS